MDGSGSSSPEESGCSSKRKRSVDDDGRREYVSPPSWSSMSVKQTWDDPALLPCTCGHNELLSHNSLGSYDEALSDVVPMDIACLSKTCRIEAELQRHHLLREQALEIERARSNVEHWWRRTTEWTRDCVLMKIDGFDNLQFRWSIGEEVLDADGEHVDTNEGFYRRVG
ncbi:MAG: hypothetical protein Q9220_006150 [cf. Caloplaca sp. 1 TL-2023]